MINDYVIRDLPKIIPMVRKKGISSINELKFGMIMIRHPDGSYTEYYPQYGYDIWKYHIDAASMYDCWNIPSVKETERELQFKWRLEYLIRTAYCLGQKNFAKELGISQCSISNYTCGKRKPDYDILVKISELISRRNRDYSSADIISFLLSVYVDPYIQQEYDLYLSEHC